MERQTSLLRWLPGRRKSRATWSIRAKILTLLLLPVVPLLAMWTFTTGATLEPALNLFAAVTNLQSAGLPATTLVDRLQTERQLSTSWVGGRHDATTKTSLAAARTRTDAAAATLIRDTSTRKFHGAESDLTRGYLGVLDRALGRLPAERAAIDRVPASRAATRGDVMTYFDGAIDDALGVYGSIVGVDDHDLAGKAGLVIGLIQAREMFAREDAIVAGATAAQRLTPADYSAIVASIGTERYLYQQATRFLPADDQRTYQAVLASAAFTRLRGAEDQLSERTATKSGLPVGFNATQWSTDFDTVNVQLKAVESTETTAALAATKPAAVRIVVRLAVAGGIGLIVLIVLIVVSIRIARGIIGRIHRLRTDALHLARHRLPSVVARLRRGEPVDVAAESPPFAYGSDEVGELGDAFSRVQRTAIASAVHEAGLRYGFNQMILNIARRSQTLLHRQLELLDDIERRVTDPDDLAELFRIDHLATRMRRHAEDLVILAGATPGRAWRYPVALTDVLRAAAAEVEQYTRIAVLPLPDVALAGRAVGDTVHLIAELLENATTFSPPDSQVTVLAQLVPHGFAIEIEDRGLGMTPEALEESNTRLAAPADFQTAHGSRLGLFVVTQLAAKHGIAVTLRRSPYGGVTAVALLPPALVVAEAESSALTSTSSRLGARMLMAAQPNAPGDLAIIDGPATESPPDSGDVVDSARPDDTPDDDNPDDDSTDTGGSDAGGPPVPRQRTLTLIASPPVSTVRGVTAEGLPQRVRPSGRGDRTVRLAPALVTDDAAPDAPATTEPGRTDGDASPRVASRTPERMRTMLTSFQDGTALGRRARTSTDAVPTNQSVTVSHGVPAFPGPADGAATADPAAADVADASNTEAADTRHDNANADRVRGDGGGPDR